MLKSMGKIYQSTKVINGFSSCFRQWRAKSHCSKLHGYSLEFKLIFESNDLDWNNWVVDFGFLKSEMKKGVTFKEWFDYMFDHTTLISQDDPEKGTFTVLNEAKIVDLRILEKVGCEAFSELVYNIISGNLHKITQNPSARLVSVECMENKKNSAIFKDE